MLKKSMVFLLITGLLVSTCKQKESKITKEVTFKTLSSEEINQIIEQAKAYEPEPVTEDEVAVIETNLGKIVFKFYPDVAPVHCLNFKRLANSGFYNGTTFHRVIPSFMIQGGDILSRDGDRRNDGTGGPGYTIHAEFSQLKHLRGTVSMARAMDPNSAGSQFFICVAPKPHLDGQYSIFGEVIEGMTVVDKIVNVPRDANDNPLEPVVMTRVYVTKNSSQ